MPVKIRLDPGVKGHEIIRKKCPNCGAEFVFRLTENEVEDILGDGYNRPMEKVVTCKVCISSYKYTAVDVGTTS